MQARFIFLFIVSLVSTSYANGKITGRQGTAKSIIGLRPGDVLKSFDGVEVTNPADAADKMQKLDNIGVHEVEIERDGKIQKITYEIK